MTADLATWNAFVRRPEWFDDAACRAIGVQAFFDTGGARGRHSRRADAEARAVAICADCPVRLDCLAYGLLEEHGIWGGRTEDERRQMRRGAGLDALRVNTRDTPPTARPLATPPTCEPVSSRALTACTPTAKTNITPANHDVER